MGVVHVYCLLLLVVRPAVSQTQTAPIHNKQALVGALVGIAVAVMSDSGTETESDPPPFYKLVKMGTVQ